MPEINGRWKLKKDGWYVWLMKYTWNYKPSDFAYMCPFFWLSVFNVIIAPVFIPVKFTLQTILWRVILKYVWVVLCYGGKQFEAGCEWLADKHDAWSKRMAAKWDAQREAEILAVKGMAERNLQLIPKTIFTRLGSSTNDYYWRNEVENFVPHSVWEEGKGAIKKWKKWYRLLLKVYQEKETKVWDSIMEKRDKILADIERSKVINDLKPFLIQFRDPTDDEIEWARKEKLRIKGLQMQAEEEERLKELKRIAEENRVKEMRKAYLLKVQEAQAEVKRKREEAAYKRMIRNKQRIGMAVKFLKPIVNVIIWTVAGIAIMVALWLLWLGGKGLYHFFADIKHTTYVKTGNVLKTILIWLAYACAGVTAIILLILGWKGLEILFSKIKLPTITLPKISIPMPVSSCKIETHEQYELRKYKVKRRSEFGANMNKYLWQPLGNSIEYCFKMLVQGLYYVFAWPLIKAFKGIKTFFRILKQTYDDNCPAIDWD